jgi:hypothetical protein
MINAAFPKLTINRSLSLNIPKENVVRYPGAALPLVCFSCQEIYRKDTENAIGSKRKSTFCSDFSWLILTFKSMSLN